MKYDLVIRSEAEADLQNTYDWYEERTEGLGDSFLLSVDASFHSMLRNPKQYRAVHKTIRRALTRRFPYQILFFIEGNKIIVIAVFHIRRDPGKWKRRR